MLPLPESPSVTEVGNFYDTFDPHYRHIWGEHLHHGYWDASTRSTAQAITNLLDLAAEWLQITRDDHILDIGCGYGASGRYLAERHKCYVLGLTVAREQFRVGKQRNQSSRVSIQHTDWMEFDAPKNTLNGILSLECLSHVSNKYGFFKKIEETLSPGSRAVITCLAATNRGKGSLQQLLITPLCQGARFPSIAELSDLEYWGQNANLRIVHAADLTPRVSKTWLAISIRSARAFLLNRNRSHDQLQFGRKELQLSLNAIRLQLAYWLGAIQYRLLVLEKPKRRETSKNPS